MSSTPQTHTHPQTQTHPQTNPQKQIIDLEFEGLEFEGLEFDDLEREYISTLDMFELKALKIAKTQLESSFNLKRSNGYVKWIAKRK